MAVSLAGKSIKQLTEERTKLAKQAQEYHSRNEFKWSDENEREFNAMMADADTLKAGVDRLVSLQSIDLLGGGGQRSSGPISQAQLGNHDFSNQMNFSNPMNANNKVTSFQNDQVTFVPSTASISESIGSTVENGFGHYLRGTILGRSASGMPPEIVAALNESIGSAGGYTTNLQVAAGVLDLARANSVLSQAGAMTAILNSNEYKMVRQETDPNISKKLENEAFDETSFTLGAVHFVPILAGCLIKTSRELAEDSSVNFVSVVENTMSKALAVAFDNYGLNGTGAGQPLGVCEDATIPETGSIGAIAWADFAAATTAMRVLNYEPGAFIAHPSIMDAVTNSYSSSFGWVLPPPSIRDKKFLSTTNMPTTKVVAGDFSNLIIALRQGPIIESTNQAGDAFAKHQIWMKITQRFDIGIVRPNAFHRLAGVTAS